MDKVNYHIEDEEIRDIYEGLSEPSRITNRTDEVEAMMTSGGSLFAYELMQGMVDYGADVEPPPRVTIESKDGKRFIFDGFRPEGLESDQIAAIEFTHYGPGFNPEYLLNFDGESKDYEDKMGTHGRGTKISLAYLAFNGVQTAICSYDIDHNDQPWMARTSSARTRIGGRQTVSYQFAKLDKSTPKRTTFRIENPTSEICNQFFEIRSLFLHANPMYPGAKAVLLKEDAVDVKLFEHKIENGWITCLKGVMNGDESRESFPYVYVDYLKINLGYRAAILPWSIVGLGQSENFRYQVVRSHSSTHVEHDWKIDYVLANTIRNLNDKELLRVLIRTAVNNPNTSYREFKEDGSEIEVKMADTTASLICEIWAEDFGDALITDSEDRIKYAYGDRKPDKRIIIVEDNVFKFLSEAGVKTLAKHCDIIGTRKVDHNLKIPYARQENNLEQLVASIPAADGTISVVKNPLHDLQGKFLQIRFPFAVVTEEDFSGVNANPAGNVIRSVAVVASVRNMKKLIAFCRIGDILHELHFAVQSKIDEETLFEIQVDIIKRKVAQNSPYAAYESEHTYVFLSGDEINSMSNPTRLDRLMEIFFEIVGKIRAQLEKVPLDQGVRATRAYTKGLGEKAQRRIEEKKKR
ncbi:hypothetical protein KKG51_01690, partial [Patescibacteria group bacterium]|nr:hypothetical protein [Patescibacteria group bacterium]